MGSGPLDPVPSAADFSFVVPVLFPDDDLIGRGRQEVRRQTDHHLLADLGLREVARVDDLAVAKAADLDVALSFERDRKEDRTCLFGDEKGFCVVDLDPALPQGRRMTNFEFHKLEARNFVTVDVSVEPLDIDPTATVVRAIARKDIAGSVVRVRISLAAESDAHLRETEIRAALEPAHFIASVSREVESTRRTRISPSEGEDLQPMQALGLYLDSKEIQGERREKIMRKAEELIELDSAEP